MGDAPIAREGALRSFESDTERVTGRQVFDYGEGLSPTAGDAALLAPWPRNQRFGVEIEGIGSSKRADYNAIKGDVQRAFPMLRKLGVQFPRIGADPPFGLTWTDGTGRPENSAVAVGRMSLALPAPDGVGAFIRGRDRFRREVLPRGDAAGVFATRVDRILDEPGRPGGV